MGTSDIPVLLVSSEREPHSAAVFQAVMEAQRLLFRRLAASDAVATGVSVNNAISDLERVGHRRQRLLAGAELARVLSHRQAWKVFLEDYQAPFAAIFEDTIRFVGPALALPILEGIQNDLETQWGVIKLGGGRLRRSTKFVASLYGQFCLAHERRLSKSNGCYLITRDAAVKLLEATMPAAWPLDTHLQYARDQGLEILSVVPPLVMSNNPPEEGPRKYIAQRALTMLNTGWHRVKSSVLKRTPMS